MRAFSEAIQRSRRRHLADQLFNLRAAKYPKNEFQAYLRKLTDDDP